MKASLPIHHPSMKHIVIAGIAVMLLLVLFSADSIVTLVRPQRESVKAAKTAGPASAGRPQWNIIVTSGELVNEAFRGYDLSKAVATTSDDRAGDLASPPAAGEKSVAGASDARHDAKAGGTAKTGKPSAAVRPVPQPIFSVSELLSRFMKDETDSAIPLIAKNAAAAGLSEEERLRLIESYKELRKVLPESEAEKLIMLQIRSSRKQQ